MGDTLRTDSFPKFTNFFGGLNGFDDLRKYIKQGNEFCRNVAAIIQERIELEQTYAKGLQRIGAKLARSSSSCIGAAPLSEPVNRKSGSLFRKVKRMVRASSECSFAAASTISNAWGSVAQSMEEEAELHKSLATYLQDDLYKPMTNLADAFQKSRKPVEAAVDKSVRTYQDRVDDEVKAKKISYSAMRDSEKAYELLSSSSNGATNTMSSQAANTTVNKVEKKCRCMADTSKKADRQYYDYCTRAEMSRQNWEEVLVKSLGQMQVLEVDRLNQLVDMLRKYHAKLAEIGPGFTSVFDRLNNKLALASPITDLRQFTEKEGSGPVQTEQILLDLPAEQMNVEMNKQRRELVLRGYLAIVRPNLEKEKKTHEGLLKLLVSLEKRPEFADEANLVDIKQQIHNSESTINFFDMIMYKLECALAAVLGQPQPSHPLSGHLERIKDKNGLPQTILRGSAVCVVSRQLSCPPSLDESKELNSDFSESDEEIIGDTTYEVMPVGGASASTPTRRREYKRSQSAVTQRPPLQRSLTEPQQQEEQQTTNGDRKLPLGSSNPSFHCIGWCRAKYSFQARSDDELTIKEGDVISIYTKESSDWWHGELNGASGRFPAQYVEEF